MDKLLTIVIPTYNMQDYINRCLDSLVIESSLMEQLEVLVVNDGSKDSSSAIAHEYEAKFPGTFRVIDKENGNYGSCVNRGLAEAQGMYIKVLDADDWFDTEEFVSFMQKLDGINGVDMVLTDFQKVSNKGEVLENCKFELEYDTPFSFRQMNNMEYYAHHSITYLTQLLRDISYHQTEGIPYTDNEWMYFPQLYVNQALYANNNVYRYCIGREGQTMDPQVKSRNGKRVITLLMNMISYASIITSDIKAGFSYKRLESFIVHSSKGLYKDFLVNMDEESFDADTLRLYDSFLFKERKDIYDILDKELRLKVVPVHYVRYWRKHGKRFPVDWFREAYRSFRYGK